MPVRSTSLFARLTDGTEVRKKGAIGKEAAMKLLFCSISHMIPLETECEEKRDGMLRVERKERWHALNYTLILSRKKKC